MMSIGAVVPVVLGVRSSERKTRQGRAAWENGLKVARKVVIVLIGIVMMAVKETGEVPQVS